MLSSLCARKTLNTREMRTIVFIDFLYESGTSTGLLTQLDYMKRMRGSSYRAVVIGSSGSVVDRYSKRIGYLYYGIDTATDLQLFWKNPVHELRSYLRTLVFVLSVALREKPDILHCYHYMWSMYAVPIGLFLQVPTLIHLKDVWIPQSFFMRWWFKFRRNIYYIAVSNYVCRVFSRQYRLVPKVKVRSIYDGIDDVLFRCVSPKELRRKLNKRKKTCIMISRIAPERGVEDFIEIARLLHTRFPLMRFVHCGYVKGRTDETYLAKIRSLIQTHSLEKVVTLRPYVASSRRVAALLRNAYVFVMPAQQFALPNAAIESLLSGTPALCFDTGGSKEIYARSNASLLIRSCSTQEMVRKIARMIEDPVWYRQCSLAGRPAVQKKFSAAERIPELMGLYEKLFALKR